MAEKHLTDGTTALAAQPRVIKIEAAEKPRNAQLRVTGWSCGNPLRGRCDNGKPKAALRLPYDAGRDHDPAGGGGAGTVYLPMLQHGSYAG